jgi:hypothetical protein
LNNAVNSVGNVLILASRTRCIPREAAPPVAYDGYWVTALRNGKIAYWCRVSIQLRHSLPRVDESNIPAELSARIYVRSVARTRNRDT